MKRRNRLLALCLCFALLLGCLPTVRAADTATDIQQQICADYYEQYFASRPNSEVELDDVQIERFYGYFPDSDCYIVLMHVGGDHGFAYTVGHGFRKVGGAVAGIFRKGPAKLRRGIQCARDHGVMYTIKRGIKKLLHR